MAAFIDGRLVGRLEPGDSIDISTDPGDHEVHVRLSFFTSVPVRVRLLAGHSTVVSFAVEDPRRDAVFGWRAVAHRTRGPWGARVEPPRDRVADETESE